MKQIAPQLTGEKWLAEKEREVATPARRGKKRAPVDKERRELCRRVLFVAHDRLRSWEAVAHFYGLSKAAAHRIAKDDDYRPSKAMMNAILETGLPMARRVWIDPCPDCGSVHHARCNGNGGTVVVLAPGETVRRVATSRTRPHYYRPCLPATLTPEQRAQVVAYALELAGPLRPERIEHDGPIRLA